MIASANQQLAGHCLLLEVALQAERLVSRLQHLRIYRAVRVVTCGAAFAERFVLEHKRAALRFMAAHASIIQRRELSASTFDRLSLVWFVAFRARHFAMHHGMGMRQLKFAALVEVALKAGFGVLAGVHNIVRAATNFGVHAARAVTRLAPHIFPAAAGRD